jgi:outer membrane protein assembly factor BamB
MVTLKIIKSFLSIIFAICILVMNVNELQKPGNFAEPIYTQSFALSDELFRGQGVTTDGEYYYFSYNVGLMKTELDAETVVKQCVFSIPLELFAKGCNHIGGITYYNGKIYAPLEDSKKKENLYLLCYDANTLELIKYVNLPTADYENGVPWCVADREKGLIYSGGCNNFDRIYVRDAETLEYLYTIKIDTLLLKIQGGDIYKGVMYCAASRNGQCIYAINLSTGEVQTVLERNLYGTSEGEDMTVLPMADGTFFHVLDIGDIRIGGHFRHYAFNPENINWEK